MIRIVILFAMGLLLFGCNPNHTTENTHSYQSETLEIQQLGSHVYQHTSFLDTESFGRVPCNGMIVVDQQEAIIFDTPADSSASLELINWVENKLDCTVKAIVPTHFHADCLGGLEVFHQHNIPSYANNATISLARQRNSPLPQNGFDSLLELQVGDKKVIAEFFGEGHTKDNVIGYVPDEKIIFGGCLIKEVGAGKGNLEDANVQEWPSTVAKLNEKYPDTKIVIPGHGKPGSTDLLEYTIQLFE